MLETDYLIIGSGALGMAFADTILDETDAAIIIVDKLHKPGGHWNHAYPFVRLHQPSAYYGVNSTELSKGRIDKVGFNEGMNELASGEEICAYFNEIMNHRFLTSGRVKYFPLCMYQGDSKFTSILTGETFEVKVNRKIVNASYLKTTIPFNHTPNFIIDPNVQFIPPNDLPDIKKKPDKFVVIGAGKTGIDTILWLIENRVRPDRIKWIVSRDAWLLDRKNFQLNDDFSEYFLKDQAAQIEALALSKSIPQLFGRLEKAGSLLRIDKTIRPTAYRCATVSQKELEQLRMINDVVRLGRIKRVEKHQIILEKGVIATSPDTIHIDCSAAGVSSSEVKNVFLGNTITLQPVRTCQFTFSAAFIAHVEATYTDEIEKNNMCTPIPAPKNDVDWITMVAIRIKNQGSWTASVKSRDWLSKSRLEGGSSRILGENSVAGSKGYEFIESIKRNMPSAIANLQSFVVEIES